MGRLRPGKCIKLCDEGIGEEVIVVDELRHRGHGQPSGTPQRRVLPGPGRISLRQWAYWRRTASAGRESRKRPVSMMARKRQPISLFSWLGELDRDDTGRKGFVEQRPEAFAHTGGIDDDVVGLPGFDEALELTEDGEVVETHPLPTVDDAVGGGMEGCEGGEVDGDDGEGGGVTGGILEGGIVVIGEGGGHGGFVLTGDVEEEGDRMD